MDTRRIASLVLTLLLVLQPVSAALADGADVALAPAQLDQLMADRYGPLSYRPRPDTDAASSDPAPDAGVPLLGAASTGTDAAVSSTPTWMVVALVVVIVVVAASIGGGSGGSGY